MADITALSDTDLLAALKGPSSAPDISKLSDEDLIAALGQEPVAPDMTAGRGLGLAARSAIQAAPGIATLGIPAAADILVGGADYLGKKGRQLVGLQTEAPSFEMPLSETLAGYGKGAADWLGLPEASTDAEKIATGAGQAGLEAFGSAGLAKLGAKALAKLPDAAAALGWLGEGAKTQAALGALAGGGGEIARQNDVNPLLGAGAGLLLGGGTIAATQGARQGISAARDVANRVVPRTAEDIRRAASEELRGRFADPDAARAVLDAGAGREYVPGSKPTTFQATGDLGAGSLERELQTDNRDLFAARRGEQNAAQVDTLRQIGGNGAPGDVVKFLKSQLDDIDATTARAEAQARRAAEDTANELRTRGSSTPEDIGTRVRASMAEADKAATERERALWDAIDPDKTLSVATGGVKRAAQDTYGAMTQAGRLGVAGAERQVADLVKSYGPSVPFAELKDLGTRVKEAARSELMNNGQTQTYARLTRLSSAVRDSMASAAATDPVAATRVTAMAEAPRAVGPAAPRAAAPKKPGLSLAAFIAKNGGLPLDAESAARDFGSWSAGRNGRVARADGRSIDGYWRNKLIDNGYLPKDPDGGASRDITNELFSALENERAGRAKVTAADEVHLAGDEAAGNAEHAAAARQIEDELRAAGVDPREIDSKAVNDAAELLARGEATDGVSAYERAVMGMDEADLAPRAPAYEPKEGPVHPAAFEGINADPDAARRYREATQATREKYNTYRRGPAGQVLRASQESPMGGANPGGYRMSPASVAKNAFTPGPTGGERIRAMVAAGAKPADIAESAAVSLQRYLRDGLLDPRGFTAWKRTHEAALRELPADIRKQFATAALATNQLKKAGEARKAALDGYRKTVLGKIAQIDPADMPRHIAGILNARDGVAQMRRLVDATKGNPAARDGLRKAVGEHILDKLLSNKEVATSGERRIKADAFASFIKAKEPMLRLVLDAPTVANMKAIALDIRRSERSLDAIRIPNTSNTASDIKPLLDKAAKKAGEGSLLTQILLGAVSGGTAGGLYGALAGGVGAGAIHFAGSARAGAKAKIEALILGAMLDPEKGRALLTKAPLQSKPAQELLRRRLGRLSILPAASAAGAEQ